jgi:hypothetical protein
MGNLFTVESEEFTMQQWFIVCYGQDHDKFTLYTFSGNKLVHEWFTDRGYCDVNNHISHEHIIELFNFNFLEKNEVNNDTAKAQLNELKLRLHSLNDDQLKNINYIISLKRKC